MTIEPTVGQEPATAKSEVLCTEAPASWNTSYVTQDGFVCRLTLRGETGKDLLERAGLALSYLLEHGYQPERSQRRDYKRARRLWTSEPTLVLSVVRTNVNEPTCCPFHAQKEEPM